MYGFNHSFKSKRSLYISAGKSYCLVGLILNLIKFQTYASIYKHRAFQTFIGWLSVNFEPSPHLAARNLVKGSSVKQD